MSNSYDLVVLGAGSGGYAAALRASQLGLSVALVERDKLGGTCLHRGCIPTKALLHAAEVADTVAHAADFGIDAHLDGVNMADVLRSSDRVVARLYQGLQGLVRARSIELIAGEGRLVVRQGHAAVDVGGRVLTGRAVVLATGSYPRTLPGITVDGERVVTSDEALRLDRVPASVVVLGGGVIGVEMASAWRSLGARVSIVEALDRLVPSEEPAASAALQRAFGKRGIACRTSVAVTGVSRTEAGVAVQLADGAALEAELLLVAVGRGPRTDGFGYAEAGVTLAGGWVEVDERLEASLPNVFAVGDLVAGPQLAHRGFAHGIFVAEEVAHRLGRWEAAPAAVDDATLPRVTYSDPEIASVGLTEEQAREGGDVDIYQYDLAGNGRSQIVRTQGFVRVIRRTDGPVLGIHLVGARVSELIGEAQLIAGWEAFPADVAPLVHAHPTLSEALGEAHLALAGKPLHSHK